MPRHRLFVYGTLMQADRLRRLLPRPPRPEPATLEHHRRRPLRGRAYPGLWPARHRRVAGQLLSGLTAVDLAALDRYEGSEYRRARVSVDTERGKLPAWTYVIRRPG